MNHPPIPPGCKYFVEKTNGVDDKIYVCFQHDPFCAWPLIRADKYQRPIIAAVARCAWEDEAAKFAMDDLRRYECQKNAEAWRIWGFGEERGPAIGAATRATDDFPRFSLSAEETGGSLTRKQAKSGIWRHFGVISRLFTVRK